MPNLENVMYNYMSCNQMMIGSMRKYAITYKSNEKTFILSYISISIVVNIPSSDTVGDDTLSPSFNFSHWGLPSAHTLPFVFPFL